MLVDNENEGYNDEKVYNKWVMKDRREWIDKRLIKG